MRVTIVAEEQLIVGTETVVMGHAPEGRLAAVFEDDGNTGYFYALDPSVEGNAIQDAVHIYNVANVVDRERPSLVEIGWSHDNLKAVLLINDHPHAVFDFALKQGYCRTGVPPPNSVGVWSVEGHHWFDGALELFA